jgi:hypothetical protein
MEQKQTIEAWANYVIERWELEILRLGINSTGKLLKSFTQCMITQANGNIEKITFAFEYYGKFVDMGVGRGVTIAEVSQSGRTPKPWYNKTFFGQVKKLGEILAKKYQQEAVMSIVESIELKTV